MKIWYGVLLVVLISVAGCGGTSQIADTPVSDVRSTTPEADTPVSDVRSTTPEADTPVSDVRSTTPEAGLANSIECSVSEHSMDISCKAPRGISGNWASNATTHVMVGSTFEFRIESAVPEIVVELEVCVANGCNTVAVHIEPPPLDSLRAAQSVKQEIIFWNQRPSGLPNCSTDFRFTHQLADPEDVRQMMFGPGSHIEPHEHMLYWESGAVKDVEPMPGEKRQESRKIELYAPADIYRIHVGESSRSTEDGDTYIEWGGYLYTCNGHRLMLGHIGEPSAEIKAILAETEPTCEQILGYAAKNEIGCVWAIDTLIPSGTPIFKSSGYAGAFDFGLELFGFTADELQEQPGYGYSITPWRVSSGRAVCPLEYFSEPLRSEYLKLLRDHMTGQPLECGPFNQDVPGTAMGFWMPSPSPEIVPLLHSDRSVDEWEAMWLFEDGTNRSNHIISVGNNTFGLEYGQYSIPTVSEGLVNRRWDSIKSDHTYCSELKRSWADSSKSKVEKTIVMRLSEDGISLTIEATTNDKCGDGPWIFQGGERIFYR